MSAPSVNLLLRTTRPRTDLTAARLQAVALPRVAVAAVEALVVAPAAAAAVVVVEALAVGA